MSRPLGAFGVGAATACTRWTTDFVPRSSEAAASLPHSGLWLTGAWSCGTHAWTLVAGSWWTRCPPTWLARWALTAGLLLAARRRTRRRRRSCLLYTSPSPRD
eukprot:5423257-Alexandrium_andersonii.AAC.1